MTGEQEVYALEIFMKVIASGKMVGQDFSRYKSQLVEKGVSPQEADETLRTLFNCLDCMKQLGMTPDKNSLKRHFAMANGDPEQLQLIFPIHGMNTHGHWHKELSDVGTIEGWTVRQNRWTFGKFRIIWFMLPITRNAKLRWLRNQYDLEKNDSGIAFDGNNLPSVIAHSFGTYLLGYALLRFRFMRFNKVILCGSILPVDFPWDKIIERGQVQAVRNEYGNRDPWVSRVRGYIRHTGPSGYLGFTCKHERLVQDEFNYDHGDYFGRDHMVAEWFPFLDSPYPIIEEVRGKLIPDPKSEIPWGIYLGLLTVAIVLWLGYYVTRNWSDLTGWTWWSIGAGLLILAVLNIWALTDYTKPPK